MTSGRVCSSIMFLSNSKSWSIAHSTSCGTPKCFSNKMPNFPKPYKMLDWYEKTKNFDEIIFNHQVGTKGKTFIWLDNSERNFPQTTFGLYTVIDDVRQGPMQIMESFMKQSTH